MAAEYLDESFEGTGYENSWSESDGTNAYFDADSTAVARPTGGGDQILHGYGEGSGDSCQTGTDLGADKAVTYTTLYFYLDDLTDGDSCSWAIGYDSSWNESWQLNIANSGGTYTMTLSVYYNSQLNTEDTFTISVDTWYKIDVKYDVTGSAWEWRKDGSSEGSGSSLSNMSSGVRYLYLYTTIWDAAPATLNYYADRIWIDDSAYGYATAYTITCDAGSYAITGTALSPLLGRKISATAGSYTITGTAMSPLYNKAIDADAGSYAITGTAMSPLHAKKLSLAAGSYEITGTAMSPLHNKKLTLDAGSYTITGTAVTLTYSGGAAVVSYGSGWHQFQRMSQN